MSKTVFVLESNTSTRDTIYRGEALLSDSDSHSFLETDLVLIDALGRKFYIVQKGDEDGLLEKVEIFLGSKAGMQGPHVYAIELSENRQSIPAKSGFRQDPSSERILWEDDISSNETSD